MRRMLYLPSVNQQTLSNNAGFQEFYRLSESLRDSGQKAYWYVVVPSWVTDGLRGHANMQYVYIDGTRDRQVNDIAGVPAFELAQYFSRRGGRFPIDGVLSNCVQYSSYVSRLLGDAVRGREVPVFVRDHDDLFPLRDDLDVRDWFFLVANYLGGHTLLRSESERKHLARLIRRHASGVVSKTFLDRALMWPVGYDKDEVLGQVSKARKNVSSSLPVLFCGGDFAFSSARRKELEIARKIYTLGLAKVWVSSVSPRHMVERAFPKQDMSFASKVDFRASLDVYDRGVASGHFFVSMLDVFDTIAVEEELRRMVFGQVGIFPNNSWITSRIGNDYPFLFNPGVMEEATVLASWVAENYDQASKMVAPVIEELREVHAIEMATQKGWDEIQSVLDSEYQTHEAKRMSEGQKQSLLKTVYRVAKGLGDGFYLDVFLDVLEEYLPWLKPWGTKGALKELGATTAALPTLYEIREILDNFGWVDTCDSHQVRIHRERDPLPEMNVDQLEGN